jgi:hypothetical protein
MQKIRFRNEEHETERKWMCIQQTYKNFLMFCLILFSDEDKNRIEFTGLRRNE